MFDTLIFLGQTSWRGDAAHMANTVLVQDQRQGTFYSTEIEVPAAADAVEVRATGFSQDRLRDSRTSITLGLQVSGDAMNWIGRAAGGFVGNPDAHPKPPATEIDDPNFEAALEAGPTRPRYVRAYASTPGLETYALVVTFSAEGVPL